MMQTQAGGLGDFLATIGGKVYLWILDPIYKTNLDAMFLAALALAVGIFGTMLWRSQTRAGKQLMLTRPGLYALLHSGWWAPSALILGAVGTAGLARLLHRSSQVASHGWIPRPWTPPIQVGMDTVMQIMGASTLLLTVGLLFLWVRTTREKVLNGQHGSACWATRSDIRIAGSDPKKGWPWVLPIQMSWRGTAKDWSANPLSAGRTVIAPGGETANRMVLLVGATGSGKGYTVFAPIIASSRRRFVLQDVKSECQGIDTLRALTGKEPIRWGCAAVGGWPSMRWNPLWEARSAESPADECGALAATLCPTQGNQNDFIQTLAADTLAFIFLYSSEQTLSEIGAAIEYEGLMPYMERLRVTPGLLGRLEGKNMSNWVSDAIKGALSPFCSGWGQEVTNGHDFSLEEIFERGGYVLSAEPIYSRALPIRVFWGMLIRRMLTSNNARDLTLLYDEGLAAGKIPDFQNALVTLRSKGISIVFGVQHTAGVLALYGHVEGQAILNSFVNSIYLLNGLNPEDQHKLSMQLGKRTVVEKGQAGEGKARRRAQVGMDLLEIADIERRSRSGRFWAVIRGQQLSRRGAPIIAELTGSAGAGLVRHPKPEEVEALKAQCSAIPQPPKYCPPPPPKKDEIARDIPTQPADELGDDERVDEAPEPVFADDYPAPPDDF